MELSPFQRFASFAAVVIVLAGLAVYLFLPAAAGSDSGAPGPAASSPAGSPTVPAASGQAAPTATASPGTPVPDIYRWLPFTSSGLASAAQVAVRFGADYGTFSYSAAVAAYLAPMRPLITSQL